MKMMTFTSVAFAALLCAGACNTDGSGKGQTAAVKQPVATAPAAQAPASPTAHAGCPHAKQHGDAPGLGAAPHAGCPHAQQPAHAGCPHAGKQGHECACKGNAADCPCKGKGGEGGCTGDCEHCKGKGGEGGCTGDCEHCKGKGGEGGCTGDCEHCKGKGEGHACKGKGEGHACKCDGKGPHGAGHGSCGCGKGCVMGQLMHGALALPDLRAEQRDAILALKKELHANKKGGAAYAAHAALARELAAQVKAGALNRARLQLLADRFDAAEGAQKLAAKISALNKLHGLLDAAQRQKLVGGLKLDEAPTAEPDAHHAGRAHRFFGHFTDKLALTDEQKKQIVDKVHATLGAKAGKDALQQKRLATRKAVAMAFKAEPFDAAKISALNEMHALRKGQPQPLIEMVAAALPLLKAEQKAQLAEALAQKAERIAKRVPER